MIGMQTQYPTLVREDLEKLQADKDKLVDMYRKSYDDWGPTARSIIDRVSENKESCYIWPFMRMPKLRRWYSDTGRVVLVGDGAHAVPPSSGQGVNQALEDAYLLTMLLVATIGKSTNSGGEVAPDVDGDDARTTDQTQARLLKALQYWQEVRQKRIDAVFDWATNATNVQRLPEAERKKLLAEKKGENEKCGDGDDMRWLYHPKLEEEAKAWLANRGT